jgi:alginate O-acetyltransferase complex protein AlgJ
MSRRQSIAFAAVFLCAVALPGLLSLAGLRPVLDENRAATELPDLGGDTLLDEDTYRTLAAYLSDRLPLRDRAIDLDARLDDALTLSDGTVGGLPRGRDGWLYLPDTLVEECPGGPPRDYVRAVDGLAGAAADADIGFLAVVAPDKESIYPEHLPVEGLSGILDLAVATEPGCSRTWREALVRAGAEHEWLHPLAPAIDRASDDPDDPTYHRLDTHWTDKGALAEAEAVVEGLSDGIWDPAEIVPDGERTIRADLTVLRGEPRDETSKGYIPEREGVEILLHSLGPDHFDPRNTIEVSNATSTGAPLIEGTVVLVGDSFGRRSLRLLQPYFEELYFVPWQYVAREGLATLIDGRPAAIVFQQVQRNLSEENFRGAVRSLVEYCQSF